MGRVVVIGGGFGGRLMLHLLLERRHEVVLIDNRRGGSWYFSGVLNIGYIPNASVKSQISIPVVDVVKEISHFFPQHIFSSEKSEIVEKSLRSVLTTLRLESLFHPLSGQTLPFLTTAGTIHTGISSWKSILPLPSMGDFDILIPQCMKPFFPNNIQNDINLFLKKIGFSSSAKVVFSGKVCKGDRFFSILEMNRLLDDSFEYIQDIISVVKELDSQNVFIPPILGIKRWKENLEALTEETGKNISEMAAVTESPFGSRWENECIQEHEDFAGVKATVVETKGYPGKVESIVIDRGDIIEGDYFVLATGKFLSGGIYRDFKIVKESLFGLPVFFGDTLLKPGMDIATLFDSEFTGYHPIWFTGIKREGEGRPVNEWGEVAYENLYAVGGVVEGVDYHNSGAGISATAFSIERVGLLNE